MISSIVLSYPPLHFSCIVQSAALTNCGTIFAPDICFPTLIQSISTGSDHTEYVVVRDENHIMSPLFHRLFCSSPTLIIFNLRRAESCMLKLRLGDYTHRRHRNPPQWFYIDRSILTDNFCNWEIYIRLPPKWGPKYSSDTFPSYRLCDTVRCLPSQSS